MLGQDLQMRRHQYESHRKEDQYAHGSNREGHGEQHHIRAGKKAKANGPDFGQRHSDKGMFLTNQEMTKINTSHEISHTAKKRNPNSD